MKVKKLFSLLFASLLLVMATTMLFACNKAEDKYEITLSESQIKLDRYEDKSINAALTLNGKPAEFSNISWISDNENVVTIDNDGHIVATGVGDTVVRATINDISKECQVNVYDSGEKPYLKVYEKNQDLFINHISEIRAEVIYKQQARLDAKIEYILNEGEDLITLTANQVKGLKFGETKIQIKASWRGLESLNNPQLSEEISIKVREFVIPTLKSEHKIINTIQLNKDGYYFNNKTTLSGEITTNDGVISLTDSKVKWFSTDESIAIVSNGIVTAAGLQEGVFGVYYKFTTDLGNTFISPVVEIEVVRPIIDRTDNISLDFDLSSTDIKLDSKNIFNDNSKTIEIFDSLSLNNNLYFDNKLSTLSPVGERELIIYNDNGYGYKVKAIVATKILKTAQDLAMFQFDSRGAEFSGYYMLGNDIDATGYSHKGNAWINKEKVGLTGVFDGRNHIIYNITVNQGGLFGTIVEGDIKNAGFIFIKSAGSGLLAAIGLGGTLSNVFVKTASNETVIFHWNASFTFNNVVLDYSGVTGGSVLKDAGSGLLIADNVYVIKAPEIKLYREGSLIANETVSIYKNTLELFESDEASPNNLFTSEVERLIPIIAASINELQSFTLVMDAKANYFESIMLSDINNAIYYNVEISGDTVAYDKGYVTAIKVSNQVSTIKISSKFNANHTKTINAYVKGVEMISANDEITYSLNKIVEGNLTEKKEGDTLSLNIPAHNGNISTTEISNIYINGTKHEYGIEFVSGKFEIRCDLLAELTPNNKAEIVIYTDNHVFKYKLNVVTAVLTQKEDLAIFKGVTASKTVNFYGYYILGNDIDATGYIHAGHGWNSSPNNGLTGTFDGKGFSITNLTISAGGIFGTISGGKIINTSITFKGVTVENADCLAYVVTSGGVTLNNVFMQVSANSGSLFKNINANSTFTDVVIDYSLKTSGLSIHDGGNATEVLTTRTYLISHIDVKTKPVNGPTITGIVIYKTIEDFITDSQKDISGNTVYQSYLNKISADIFNDIEGLNNNLSLYIVDGNGESYVLPIRHNKYIKAEIIGNSVNFINGVLIAIEEGVTSIKISSLLDTNAKKLIEVSVLSFELKIDSNDYYFGLNVYDSESYTKYSVNTDDLMLPAPSEMSIPETLTLSIEGVRKNGISYNNGQFVIAQSALEGLELGKKYVLTITTQNCIIRYDSIIVATAVITDKDHLEILTTTINNKAITGYFILANDIDASGKIFTSINSGAKETGFTGAKTVLDGRNHTISNLSVAGFGLFGTISDGATLKNIALIFASNTGNGILGHQYGANCTLDNVYIEFKNATGNSSLFHLLNERVILKNVVLNFEGNTSISQGIIGQQEAKSWVGVIINDSVFIIKPEAQLAYNVWSSGTGVSKPSIPSYLIMADLLADESISSKLDNCTMFRSIIN